MENVRADVLANFTLPTIRNHVDQVVEERAPWEGIPTVPPAGLNRIQLAAWSKDHTTRHLFYSGFEANNAVGRLSKTNPPHMLRAIVVDYDAPNIDEAWLSRALDKCPILPNWIERSYSGGIHAIWALEEPIWVMNPNFRKLIQKWFYKKLRLKSFLPLLDEKIWNDGMVYLRCGTDWQVLRDDCAINSDMVGQCSLECAVKADFGDRENPAIPLDKVKEEIDKRWPGGWDGDFEVDSRGTRFWDVEADATGVIVKPEGFYCHTGGQNFIFWSQLLGRAFVEEYETARIGRAANCAWFDGREFWVQGIGEEANSQWYPIVREDLSRKMRVEFNMSGQIGKGATASEIDEVLHSITVTRRVDSAGPIIPGKPGMILRNGSRHLNVAGTKACEPADSDCEMDDFPWVHNFLSYLFTENEKGKGHDTQEQLLRFLAWLQHGYKSMLSGVPAQGQVLVVAGPTGIGKTLLCDVLVSGAFGGHKDASSYLVDQSRFNKNLYRAPLWVVNDANAAEPGKKARYNSLVKRTAANRTFEMEAKFGDQVDVTWVGRLIITCNVDSESIQVMPQLDMSMEDKILALRMWGGEGMSKIELDGVKGFGMTGGKNPEQHIREELPAFLSWLLAWEPPAWIARDARFGYESYHHAELKEQSESAGSGATFNEILHTFLAGYFHGRKETFWEGTSTKLREAFMAEGSKVINTAREYTGYKVSRALSALSSIHKCDRRVVDGYTLYRFDKKDIHTKLLDKD